MIDTVQAVLLLVIVLLTVLLIVLGIQVFFILRALRDAVNRANKVLENAEQITEGVSEPVTFIGDLLSGGKSLAPIIKIISGLVGGKREKKV